MAAGWIELITGTLEQKKQYQRSKARISALPANYRAAAEALERYLMYVGGIAKGEVAARMYHDLADLFEQSVANGTPVRDIVGADPVEFAETFIANYSDGQWVKKERDRLTMAIDHAAAGTTFHTDDE
ncbi:DUF1048 domain-containing protein [Rhizobium sp. BR 314]|uniref:DUF1048 domain-containing protein n=1 Tax=Rhizobium sp. BR 314 TaxID=3040013 RepID=UPI0039BFA6F0